MLALTSQDFRVGRLGKERKVKQNEGFSKVTVF